MNESVDRPMATIAVEDLITVVCETFLDSLSELGYQDHLSVEKWYMQRTDAERRVVSEKILDIIEADIKKTKEDKII